MTWCTLAMAMVPAVVSEVLGYLPEILSGCHEPVWRWLGPEAAVVGQLHARATVGECAALRSHRDRPRLGTTPASRGAREAAVSELDRLEAAAGECREMIREAHAATKDLRAAVREAKRELQDLAKDEVAAHIQYEVSRQLEELSERTREAVSAATQKVIAEFDRFGESLLGRETYWQTASGRRVERSRAPGN